MLQDQFLIFLVMLQYKVACLTVYYELQGLSKGTKSFRILESSSHIIWLFELISNNSIVITVIRNYVCVSIQIVPLPQSYLHFGTYISLITVKIYFGFGHFTTKPIPLWLGSWWIGSYSMAIRINSYDGYQTCYLVIRLI